MQFTLKFFTLLCLICLSFAVEAQAEDVVVTGGSFSTSGMGTGRAFNFVGANFNLNGGAGLVVACASCGLESFVCACSVIGFVNKSVSQNMSGAEELSL